jgi:D-tyrosyl-tRNA(Tyr) deacylase
MRAVIQRVHEANVVVSGKLVSKIGGGLLIYLAVDADDEPNDAEFIARKIADLRLFEDESGKMNLSVRQTKGEALVVSAFTVLCDARKGRRPSFSRAADPRKADELYRQVSRLLEEIGVSTSQGAFQDHMAVSSVNDGPICILLDSRQSL